MELDTLAIVVRAHLREPSFMLARCNTEESRRAVLQMRSMIAAYRYASETGRETLRLSRVLLRTLDGEFG